MSRPTLAVAAVAALIVLLVVAVGLTLPINGGILRYTPLASLVVAPLTVVALVLRPWLGLCLWILLMPLMNIAQVQVVLGPEQVILPTLFLAGFVAGLVLERRRGDGPTQRTDRVAQVTLVGMAAVAAITAVSLAFTPSLTRSLPIAQHGLIEPMVLLAAVLLRRPSWRELALLLAAMGLSVGLGSILGLTRMLLRYAQTVDQFAVQREQLSRLIYFNVGIFGNMLAMALPILLALLLLRRMGPAPRLSVPLVAATLLLCLGSLYVTFSKSGWLGSIVGCAGFLILVSRRWWMRIAVAAVALVLISFVIPYPAVLLKFISPSVSTAYNNVISNIDLRANSIDPTNPEGEVSVTERILATKAAIRMALDHPLLGVGPGGFAAAYATTYHNSAATRALDSAHDLIPYLAAEFGFIVAGLVGLGLLGGLVGAALAFLRAPPAERLIKVGAAAVGASLLAFVVVGTTFGVDLYRPYRIMNSDVLYAALLVAAGLMLPRILRDEVRAWSTLTA